jgi:O-antigen ligase
MYNFEAPDIDLLNCRDDWREDIKLGYRTASARRTDQTAFRWYYVASGFFLAQTVGAFAALDRILYGEWDGKTGDKLSQILNLILIAVSFLLFFRGFRQSRSVGTGGALALSLAIFLALSGLWSIDPATSTRRGLQYLFFVIGTIGITRNLDGDEFMRLLRLVCILSALAALPLFVVSPGIVMMGDGRDVRGVFSHKNVLGQVMAAGVLASLHGMRVESGRRSVNFLMLIVLIASALASRSGTAFVVIIIFCSVDAIAVLYRRGGVMRLVAVFAVALLIPVLAIFMLFPDLALGMLGKDATLTGRTDLWAYVMDFIAQRPILGWGFLAFWQPTNPLAEEVSTTLGWRVPEAHNGLLELLLEVGIVGTGAFLVLWIRNVAIALRCLWTSAKDIGQTALLNCSGIILVSISEEVMVDPAQISVVLFFVTGLYCEKALLADRRRRLAAGRAGKPGARRTGRRVDLSYERPPPISEHGRAQLDRDAFMGSEPHS